MDQLVETQERVLADVERTQARVVEASQRIADSAGNWTPKVELPGSDSLPSLDDLPTGRDLAASYFDFAGRMLELNRSFVEQMIGAWAPADQPKSAPTSKSKGTSKGG